MKHARMGWYFVGALLLCTAGYAQNSTVVRQTGGQLPEEALGARLVAWSELQKPQPIPQPVPPPERADQQGQSSNSHADNPAQQPDSPIEPADTRTQENSAQAFTGMIVRDGKEYVLKVPGASAYTLDDPEEAKPYEGKQVRVEGKLNPKSNVLHVLSIELLS